MMKKSKIIGFLLILFSLSIPLFSFTIEKTKMRVEEKEIEKKISQKEKYFAILEIPKLNLKKELYPKNDSRNQVDISILVHEASVFPNENNKNSKIILAGHSGNGKNAYFKNLYKLKEQDRVKIYTNGYLYEYEIKEIERQEKTGELYIKEEKGHTLILITCTYQDKKTQTIYYAKLKNKAKI